MILLDENIRQDQAIQLRRQRIPARFLVENFARTGIQDPGIIPLLHRLKQSAFFTHDRDFFRRGLVTSAKASASWRCPEGNGERQMTQQQRTEFHANPAHAIGR